MKISVHLIASLSLTLVVACGGDANGPPAGNTELNLDIINPGGTSGELGFTIDRVDYRITCAGNPTGTYPIPAADTTGTDYAYDDSVDISGAFEVVDTRVAPVWQAVMDLPPGDCTITLSVYEDDEIVCIGTQALAILQDATTKYDIVLVCSLSVDLPDGMADVDGTFEFITGNLCPKLYLLNAIPSAVVPDASSPDARTEVQYRAKDPDNTCGNNCDPQICDFSNPPVCAPYPSNSNDPPCNPAYGGDPNSTECLAGDYAGLVCTIVALPLSTPGVPGGTFLSPVDGTTPVGPVLPVNLNTWSGIPGIILPGLGGPAGTNAANSPAYPPFIPSFNFNGSLPPLYYQCDSTVLGQVVINVVCSDGDEECDQSKYTLITCGSGPHWCIDAPIPGGCDSGNECTTNGTCDNNCSPADAANGLCDRCAGQGVQFPDGTPCSQGGGSVCSGGVCGECLVDADCANSPAPVAPGTCQEPNTCVANSCVAGGASTVGTACSNGCCDGSGPPFGGSTDPPCVFSCGGFPPDPQTQWMNVVCINSAQPGTWTELPFMMTADAGNIISGSAVTVDYTGDAVFLKDPLLDAGFNLLGGFTRASADLIRVDVEVREGLTLVGPTASLTIDPFAINDISCQFGGEVCVVDTDCPLSVAGDFCGYWINVPTSDECDSNLGGDGTCDDACAPGTGFCDVTYGVTGLAQCSATGGAFPGLGYCLTADLPIALSEDSASYTADASGTVRVGWAENGEQGFPSQYTPYGLCDGIACSDPGVASGQAPCNACDPVGSYAIPGAPVGGSQAVTINVSVAPPEGAAIGRTPVGIECLQGNQPNPGAEETFPLTDGELISFPIQIP